MSIEKNSVVSFHYTVSENGAAVESSEGRDPLVILYGAGNIIPGLEKALEGKNAGDHVEVTVTPEEAYGVRNENLTQRVPLKHFQGQKLTPGQTLMLRGQQGPIMATVKKVGMSVVDLDMNHPMAGKTLSFAVDITDVRAASEEEIAHGHVHGAGGHEH